MTVATVCQLHLLVVLQEQADKAYFALQKTMLKIGLDARYCLDLFVKSVRPILTYN